MIVRVSQGNRECERLVHLLRETCGTLLRAGTFFTSAVRRTRRGSQFLLIFV
jgi:hypothetical protein